MVPSDHQDTAQSHEKLATITLRNPVPYKYFYYSTFNLPLFIMGGNAMHSFPATTLSLRIHQLYAANVRPTNVSTIKTNNELTDLIKLHLGRSGPVTFNHQYTRKRIHAMTGSSLATTPFSPAKPSQE